MKPGIIEPHFFDKHENGVHSSAFNDLGPVQSSLSSEFPEPDARFMSKLKLSKKKVTKKVTKKSKNQKIKLNP